MPGRLIDLAQPGIRLPSRLAVDTNLVVAWLLVAYYPPHFETARRAIRFYSLLKAQNVIGRIPTVACHEFFHLALRGAYQRALPGHRTVLATARPGKRRFTWEDFYKARPEMIDLFLPDLQRLLPLLMANDLEVIQPDELAPLPPHQRYEDALLHLVARYRLNTNDAAILMEAQRAGITSIATLDADLRRAALDFDVYTWL